MQRLLLVLLVSLGSVRASAQDAPGAPAAPAAPPMPVLPDAFTRPGEQPQLYREPIVLVAEGLADIAEPAAFRLRLAEQFGRPVIALSDPGAVGALATLYVAADVHFVVLRLHMEERPDLWRRLPRETLGSDPAGTIAGAVLDMLWSERLAQSASSEMLDPFCPPGLICMDADRPARRTRHRSSEAPVLDPWDGAGRAGESDPWQESRRYHTRGDPWAEEPRAVSAPRMLAAPAAQATPPERSWLVGLLAGGGVHGEGGFVRYEANLLRRFQALDVGLAFVGGRGEPDPARSVRRAVAAVVQGRLVTDGLELDVGGSLGTFMAKQRGDALEVRPYLRILSVFALPVTEALHFVLQSEVGTTFSSVHDSGAFEYALSAGVRQRL